MISNKLLNTARDILRTHAYDEAHGIDHHKHVWENVLWIIDNENLHIKTDILEVATWWHDVDKDKENNKKLFETGEKLNIPLTTIRQIDDIINQHSFGQKQTTIEGKLLFDADKLEYINLTRWKSFMLTLEANPESYELFEAYKKAMKQRTPLVYRRLYFTSTKRRFKQEYGKFQQWYNTVLLADLPNLP